MDDSSVRMRTNMEKVLRAMDVIPPFRNDSTENAQGAGSSRRASSQHQAERQRRARSQTPNSAAPQEVEGQTESKITIPEFDLGEKILAEQRRVTARKRRAPGASEVKQGGRVRETAVPPRMPLAGPSGDDLIQLQRIVADIVARDIERLCAGAAKTLN